MTTFDDLAHLRDDDFIHIHTRAQAVRDGEQFELPTALSREAGIKWPVYATAAVMAVVEHAVESTRTNDLNGVLWDMFTMYFYTVRSSSRVGLALLFEVMIQVNGKLVKHQFKAMTGPIDINNANPFITFMMPEED